MGIGIVDRGAGNEPLVVVIKQLQVGRDLVATGFGRGAVPKVGVVSLNEQRPFVGYAPARIGADSEAG